MSEKSAEPVDTINTDQERSLDKCIEFLNRIGISIRQVKLQTDSFLPGLSIEQGCILIDREALTFPGDILHEAGHIAVVPAAERPGKKLSSCNFTLRVVIPIRFKNSMHFSSDLS